MENLELYTVCTYSSELKFSLYNLATWKNGLAFKSNDFSDSGKPIIKIAELNNGISSSTAFTNQTFSKDVYLTKGDYVFSWSGNPFTSIDIYKYNLIDGWLNQHIFKVIPNEKIVTKLFFFYLMKYMKPNFIKIALNKQTTGLGHITIKDIQQITVTLPPLPTQQKIAQILSSLDDKIELNNKINANLEQQAQALFKSWFVDFESFGGEMPAEWKEKPLYEYANFINGTSFKEDEYGTVGVPIIKIAELKNGITDATQYFNGTKDSKYDVKDGDILFSWSGNPETSIDIFIWTLGNAILNQHTFNVKSNTNRKWFTYCLLKYFKPEFCHRARCKQTTGLGHVTANDLKQIMFSSDEKSEIDFENLITPIMEQIYNNKKENQKLASIRDTLLPKLMNGEIEI